MPEDVLINLSRHKSDPTLNGPVLFFVNPGETGIVIREAEQRNARRHFLFHSNLFEIPSKKPVYWVGPALGAPMAVMTLEKLIALGAKEIIVYGWCGSLVKSLKTGDLFLPNWAISEEGTSVHYPVHERPESNGSLRNALKRNLKKQYTVREGPIWTTDAPYRETREKVKKYVAQGVMAVDMEFSALCTVAAFRNINLAAVMLVSDELWDINWRPGFQNKPFKKLSRDVFLEISQLLES